MELRPVSEDMRWMFCPNGMRHSRNRNTPSPFYTYVRHTSGVCWLILAEPCLDGDEDIYLPVLPHAVKKPASLQMGNHSNLSRRQSGGNSFDVPQYLSMSPCRRCVRGPNTTWTTLHGYCHLVPVLCPCQHHNRPSAPLSPDADTNRDALAAE